MAAVSGLNAVARKRARREAEASGAEAALAGQTDVRKTMTLVTDTSGHVVDAEFNLDAHALLTSINAQTVGVAGPPRTITKNANTTLTIT